MPGSYERSELVMSLRMVGKWLFRFRFRLDLDKIGLRQDWIRLD